jgi:chitin disaccharide deacetylase
MMYEHEMSNGEVVFSMIRLIVNADDFGLSRGVNYGIIDAHRYGIVNSTTMLVNMPGAEHAVELAKMFPQLGVGVHLTLTCGKPVSRDVPSLVNANGYFKFDKNVDHHVEVVLEEVEYEWDAQIKCFLSYGLTPTHLDSHHHVHRLDCLSPVIKALSQKYQLPVRNVFRQQVTEITPFSDLLITDFYGDNVNEAFFDDLDVRVKENLTVEVMCHPAYIDSYLRANSSYCDQRLKELDILKNVELGEHFELVDMSRKMD